MIIRLRNKDTGVIIGVHESKRERFGEGWELVDAPTPEPVKQPAKPQVNRSRKK